MVGTLTREKVFKVEGMDCAECVLKIESAVRGVEGVVSAEVLIGPSKLVVKYSGDSLDVDRVMKAVESVGYKAYPEELTDSVVLYVEGMDCVDELSVIEKKLKGMQGVKEFHVNLVNQKLEVNFDPGSTSQRNIIRAIAETGMKPRLERQVSRARPWWQDARVQLIFVSGLLILTAFLLERFGFPLPLVHWLYGAAVLAGAYFPARMAIAGVRTRTLNLYQLLLVAAVGAMVLGFWSEAALLVLAYTWGAVLETFAAERARSALRALVGLMPKQATVRRGSQEIEVPVEAVKLGEIIVVRPGERIPLDGEVTSGNSSVDQAPITGESIPVAKGTGDTVFAASINQRGALEVKVTKEYQDTTLARVVHQVERAEGRRSSYQRFSAEFARIYTPAVFVLALAVAFIPPLLGYSFTYWFYRALVLMVVSCSCGLALSVPMAVLTSVSNAARKGILIKGGADLEAFGTVDVVVFDKTGTLTIGLPRVTDVIPLDSSTTSILSLAASVESRSEHPLADAIIRKAREENMQVMPLQSFEALPGLGAKGVINGGEYYVCNKRLCEELSIPLDEAEPHLKRLEMEGKTANLVTSGTNVLGILAVADQLRPEAEAAVAKLKAAGVKRVVMLTGDNEGTARAVAQQAGIDEYRARLLPEDKVAAIRALKEKYGRVAMVGDGVNDAPAMVEADVGIAMGAAGTDIAMETADLALMSDDLSKVPVAFHISRRAMRNIRQNVVASVSAVAIVLGLALAGKLDLVPGILANEGSALIVMANSLRLLRG